MAAIEKLMNRKVEQRTIAHPLGFGANPKGAAEKDLVALYSQLQPDDLIRFGLIPDDAVRVAALQNGEIDMIESPQHDLFKVMEADNPQATVTNLLAAHQNMDDKTAYAIVKTIFDKKAEMVAVHKESLNFDYNYQTNDHSPIPYHPGAIKYFAEKGIKLN